MAGEPDLADRQYQATLQSDAELLDLYVLGGQTHALITLLSRFTPMMTGVIRRVVSHAQDSEDAFQASCVILMQSAKKIRSRPSIAAWLYGVAYRTACRVRSKSRRQATGLDPLELPDKNLPDDPIQQIVRQIELSNLDRELQNLPAAYREPLVEHYILGYTARQIAERMELTSSAVEGRLRRGRQMLRERLAERGASLSVCVAGVAWMRDHQQTASAGQELSNHFIESPAFQAPDNLLEHDPYLFELVQGESKMQVIPLFKSLGFIGSVAVATVSLSMLALAMQVATPPARSGGAQSSSDSSVQAVAAQDDVVSTTAAVEPVQAKKASKRGGGGQAPAEADASKSVDSTAAVIAFVKPAAPAPSWLKAGGDDLLAAEETRDRLRKPVQLDFNGVPLRAVADELAEQLGINVVIDEQSLDNLGFSSDQPITATTKPLPVHQGLALILKPHSLTYEVHPNLIKIVADDQVQPAVRYYDLSHVLPTSAGVRSVIQSAMALIETDDDSATISVIGSMMVARCKEDSHLHIEKLLAEVAKLSPENLPANESQAKGGGVFKSDYMNGGMGGGLGGMGGGMGGGGGGMF